MILPKDGIGLSAIRWQLRLLLWGGKAAVGIEIVAPGKKGPACAVDGLEVAEVALADKGPPSRHVVKEPAPQHDGPKILLWQVFPKHRQVVAEVEEGLPWISLGERASTHMIDRALREAEDLAPCLVESPAEVYLLVVGKEASVEAVGAPVASARIIRQQPEAHSTSCGVSYWP